jgi:hypothetical protein
VELDSIGEVFRALSRAGVRYIVCGGIAVIAHGYVRLTQDIDIAIALDADTIKGAFKALEGLGYRPAVPITADQLANPELREGWQRDQSEGGKGMQVLNMVSDRHPTVNVDIFIKEFFDFDAEYDQAPVMEPLPGLPVRIVSLPTLIKMKNIAGRHKDLDDIEHLEALHTSLRQGNKLEP